MVKQAATVSSLTWKKMRRLEETLPSRLMDHASAHYGDDALSLARR